MRKWDKLLERAHNSPGNMRFQDLCSLVEMAGFRLRAQGSGSSHRIYRRDGIPEIVNLQNDGGKAKAYQIRQVLGIIDDYELKPEGEDEDADE